jgi:hypothetical protein
MRKLAPDEIAAKGVDIVVAPMLEYFDFRRGGEPENPRYSVVYRITLFDGAGVPGPSWLVRGDAPNPSGRFSHTDGEMEGDLRDAASKFLEGFDRQAAPMLAALARNRAGAPAAIAIGTVTVSAEPVQLPDMQPEQVKLIQEVGVLMLKVTAKTNGHRPFLMRASDMRLRLLDGRVVEPSTLGSVLNNLELRPRSLTNAELFPRGWFLRYHGDPPPPNPEIYPPEVFGRPGTVDDPEYRVRLTPGALSRFVRVDAIFAERSLAKDQEVSGIVFFIVPRGMKLDGAALTAWVLDPSAATGLQIETTVAAGRGHE